MFIANQKQIVAAIAKTRLPAVYGSSDDTDAGGLISYGPNVADGFHRAARYVDKILKGAKPADTPFEQPTKFELAVNLKTARALGITIPSSILLRADKVIE
jgi:putative ABC transport system substrate-binding protein